MRTIYSITPEISSFVPFLLGDGPSFALYLRRRIYLLNFLDVLSGFFFITHPPRNSPAADGLVYCWERIEPA